MEFWHCSVLLRDEFVTAVYAHRGASTEYPENTLAAFRRALELSAGGIELDVHLSADGVPMVIHDWTVDRTTDRFGLVSEMTFDELQSLNAGEGEKIPTLGQVLDLIGDKLCVNIEVKANEAGAAVLRELQGRNTPALILSFDWNVLRYVRSQDADVVIWPIAIAATDEAINVARDLRAPALAILHKAIDEDIVAQLKEQGLGLWVWTVNDQQRARIYADWGVIGICTDDPVTIQQALQERLLQT
jgi:glycerophosphoryl diester phosphodiesterase